MIFDRDSILAPSAGPESPVLVDDVAEAEAGFQRAWSHADVALAASRF
jgi:hypothetical protein